MKGNKMETEKILEARGNAHGPFEYNARVTQAMYFAALSGYTADKLNMILHKISRLVNGDPNHIDSWDDIAGYAKLVSNYIQGIPQPGTTQKSDKAYVMPDSVVHPKTPQIPDKEP